MTAGFARIFMAASDLDLRTLPEIARDRSPAGRAKLFAFLANLLVARWERLTAGERAQLAELIAVLWSRGAIADRARLATQLAGRADIPPMLNDLLGTVRGIDAHDQSAPAAQSKTGSAIEAGPSPQKKTLRIMVTQQQVVVRRQRPVAPPPKVDDQATKPAITPPVIEQGQAVVIEQPKLPEQQQPAVEGKTLEAPQPRVDPRDQAQEKSLLAGDEKIPFAPRDNPHRLTSDLLAEVLANGDLARFEVMLASLTGLRAPLLRRILHESGDEAFAILARAVGMDAAAFLAQWRHWQAGQVELGRAPLADRAGRKRISAFFAALTEGQIDRLLRRWRNSSDRLFAPSGSSF